MMTAGKRLVVILGCTGTGKSKLAIQLAKKFGGEVISADSMQIYQGLDIVTNKVTPEECEGVPHHLLNFLSPLSRDFTAIQFRQKALAILDEIWERKNLPIIVGGTAYYIESLLWNMLLGEDMTPEKSPTNGKNEDMAPEKSPTNGKNEDMAPEISPTNGKNEDMAPEKSPGENGNWQNPAAENSSAQLSSNFSINEDTTPEKLAKFSPVNLTDEDLSPEESPINEDSAPENSKIDLLNDAIPTELLQASAEELYEKLQKVDPDRAAELHPNDRRRVLRSLQVS